MLAAHFYERYINSQGKDRAALIIADAHLKRSLAQVTKAEDSYEKTVAGQKIEVKIPKGVIPEAYFWDTKQTRWRANENTPLHMAESTFRIMIDRAVEALKLQVF